jgi:hypothetical protein
MTIIRSINPEFIKIPKESPADQRGFLLDDAYLFGCVSRETFSIAPGTVAVNPIHGING